MRFGRRATAALTVAIGAVLFPVSSAPGTQPIRHPTETSTSLRGYAHRAAFTSLRAFGAPAGYIAAARDPRASTGFILAPARDLNGDGTEDLLGMRPEARERGEDNPGGGTVAGIDGTNGEVLWTFTEDDVYLWASPRRVGPNGEHGVLVLAFRWSWRDAAVATIETLETRLIALGGDGDELWRRSFEGEVAYSMAAHVGRDLTYPSGTFNAVEGRATDILVASRDVLATPLSWQSSLEAVIVDGATGETRSAGEEDEAESEMSVTPVPDLDGDERDDVLFLGWSEDEGPWMRARSSADGTELWSSDARVGMFSQPRRAGDVNGDGTLDLLFTNGCHCEVVELHRSTSRTVSSGVYFGGGRTALVDGATGDVLWEKQMGSARVAGDIDRDGQPDIAGQRVSWRRSGVAITYSAVNGAGQTLYRRTYEVPSRPGESAGDVDAYSNVGDVDLDGITDSVHAAAFADLEEETFASDRGLVSGRNGNKRWSRMPGRPLHATIDGTGADLLDVDVAKEELRLVTQDGASGLPLWKARVARPRGGQMVLGRDLTGDGLAEVVVTFVRWGRRFAATTIVFDALDGGILWRL